MSGVSAEQIILEAGKSPELVAAFQMVAEAEVMGEPKFSPQICRDLAKIIVCRTYATPALELCHLVRIADAVSAGAGYEMFFWGEGPSRVSLFRNVIVNAYRSGAGREQGLRADASGVVLDYPDGEFTITYSRMPFLSALLEFLLSSIGYVEADSVFREVLRSGLNRKSISKLANVLAKAVYDYLKDHLPTAQNQRKFRRLIGFLENRVGPAFDVSVIDDATILDFWIQESPLGVVDGVDFKTFAMSFKAFVRLRQTLEQAADLNAFDNARPIGTDFESGEVDPDSILSMVDAVDEYRSPLAILQEHPADAVKSLNKRETGVLELLLECGTTALSLPLSVMRSEVFGRGQGQVTQALRRKATAEKIAAVIEASPPETFEDRTGEFARVAEHIERALLACFHALVKARHAEAITVLIAVRPNMDLRPLADILGVNRDLGDNVVTLRADSVSDHFLVLLEDAERVGAELAQVMTDARQAFRSLARQGFAEDDINDSDIVDGHAAGVKALNEARNRLQAFLERLNATALPEADWVRQFAADKRVFARQFELLYGGTDDGHLE